MTPPKVSIILINWKQSDVTAACLLTLERLTYPAVQIVVVDNGSHDGSVERLRREFPNVLLVESDQNLGFTGGNNLGMRFADGEWLLLLNNDTEVPPDFLEPLIEAALADPTIGALSPTLRFFDQPDMIQYAGGGGFDLWLGRGLGWRGNKTVDVGQYERVEDTWSAHGAAFLVRREVVEQIGTLWEDYFIYYEELDWSMRIREAGWRIVYVPGSVVYHKESVSTGKHSSFKTYYMSRNRVLFVRRHGDWLHQIVFGFWAGLGVIPTHAVRFLLKRRPDLFRALVTGLWDGAMFSMAPGTT